MNFKSDIPINFQLNKNNKKKMISPIEMSALILIKKNSTSINSIYKTQIKNALPKQTYDTENALKTETINEKIIQEIFKTTGIKAIKIKIQPILPERMCHGNARLLTDEIEDCKHVLGYNILGCILY